eukprot:2256988-Pleurochrysis_carterae.AAC.1
MEQSASQGLRRSLNGVQAPHVFRAVPANFVMLFIPGLKHESPMPCATARTSASVHCKCGFESHALQAGAISAASSSLHGNILRRSRDELQQAHTCDGIARVCDSGGITEETCERSQWGRTNFTGEGDGVAYCTA